MECKQNLSGETGKDLKFKIQNLRLSTLNFETWNFELETLNLRWLQHKTTYAY